MNDVILMSIKGGRYLEAEKETNKIILSNPSDEAYFLMGTIKSNLLLDKGRDFSEVTYCFEKSIDLSQNSEETKNQAGTFLLGIYKQLSDLEIQIESNKKIQKTNITKGILSTYLSSIVIDNSKSSFGQVTGAVGAGLGVGLALDGMISIGELDAQKEFLINLKKDIKKHLCTNYPIVKKHFDKIELESEKVLVEQNKKDFFWGSILMILILATIIPFFIFQETLKSLDGIKLNILIVILIFGFSIPVYKIFKK